MRPLLAIGICLGMQLLFEKSCEYGEHDVVAGVPCVIGANGVEEVVELPLTAEEKQTFHECCDAIRVNMTRAAEL